MCVCVFIALKGNSFYNLIIFSTVGGSDVFLYICAFYFLLLFDHLAHSCIFEMYVSGMDES